MAAQTESINRALTGSVKPRLKGWKALLTQHTMRRLVQLGFALFILYIAVVHILTGETAETTTASPEAFCPLGGLETLYKYITTGTFVSHVHLSNVVLLIAFVASAILTRSAFCGWVCPLGFIQELVTSFSRFLQKKIPGLRKFMAHLRSSTKVWSLLDHYLRYVKYLVLAWAIIGAFVYGYMVFREYDPWSTLLSLAEFSFTPGVIVLGLTLVASFFVERPWCRYTCPLGAASGLLGKLSPVYLKREESACTICKVCTRACPMGLNVHDPNVIKSADCITCLECVGACPRNGALDVKLGLPIVGK